MVDVFRLSFLPAARPDGCKLWINPLNQEQKRGCKMFNYSYNYTFRQYCSQFLTSWHAFLTANLWFLSSLERGRGKFAPHFRPRPLPYNRVNMTESLSKYKIKKNLRKEKLFESTLLAALYLTPYPPKRKMGKERKRKKAEKEKVPLPPIWVVLRHFDTIRRITDFLDVRYI